MIKYAYTILYVDDVKNTVDFYKNAFGFQCTFITEENDYAELKTGETKLAFASTGLASKNLRRGFNKSSNENKPFGIEMGFTTNNVQQVYENAIKNGAVPEEEPLKKPWGQTVSYVRDINGFLIEICTPIGSE